jgi:hypothetical protein
MIDSGAMPSNKKKASHSEQDYAVGDRVKVNMHRGRIVEAEIKAVIEKTRRPVAGLVWKRDGVDLFVAGSR